MNTTRMQNLVAFIEDHGNKVVSTTETTISAQCEELNTNTGEWATVTETFPATLKAARDWLGY